MTNDFFPATLNYIKQNDINEKTYYLKETYYIEKSKTDFSFGKMKNGIKKGILNKIKNIFILPNFNIVFLKSKNTWKRYVWHKDTLDYVKEIDSKYMILSTKNKILLETVGSVFKIKHFSVNKNNFIFPKRKTVTATNFTCHIKDGKAKIAYTDTHQNRGGMINLKTGTITNKILTNREPDISTEKINIYFDNTNSYAIYEGNKIQVSGDEYYLIDKMFVYFYKKKYMVYNLEKDAVVFIGDKYTTIKNGFKVENKKDTFKYEGDKE